MGKGLLYGILAVLVLIAALVYGCRWFGRAAKLPPPEELLRQALTAPDEQARTAAAAALVQHGGRARPELRKLAADSPSPRVRATAIMGLAAAADYEREKGDRRAYLGDHWFPLTFIGPNKRACPPFCVPQPSRNGVVALVPSLLCLLPKNATP